MMTVGVSAPYNACLPPGRLSSLVSCASDGEVAREGSDPGLARRLGRCTLVVVQGSIHLCISFP